MKRRVENVLVIQRRRRVMYGRLAWIKSGLTFEAEEICV
jgi:hypothetical protein